MKIISTLKYNDGRIKYITDEGDFVYFGKDFPTIELVEKEINRRISFNNINKAKEEKMYRGLMINAI